MVLRNDRLGASSPAHLYATETNISIYSTHIHNIIEHCTGSVFQISRHAVRSRTRSSLVALARQTGMYLANVVFGLNYSQTGRLFQRDRTTVAHACSVIENLRDDPAIDRALNALEMSLRHYRL